MVSGKLKQLSDSEDSNKSPAMESSSQIRRTCVDCNTTKTPLWRGGPAGPRSLCNACGIRHRKSKRAALLASDERSKAKNKLKKKHTNARRCEKGLQMRVMGVGGKMEKLREEEEEEAAILLMALSYGYGCAAATCV